MKPGTYNLNRRVYISCLIEGESFDFVLNQITDKTIQLMSEDGQRFNFDRFTGKLRGGKGRIKQEHLEVLLQQFSYVVILPTYKVTKHGIESIRKYKDIDE